jgi:hypothetical protein
MGRAGHTTPLCGSHPFQRHQPADVLGKVLQADFGFRPRDANRPVPDNRCRNVLGFGLLLPGVCLCLSEPRHIEIREPNGDFPVS